MPKRNMNDTQQLEIKSLEKVTQNYSMMAKRIHMPHELCCEYIAEQKRLAPVIEDNRCLRCENEWLEDNRKATAHELETARLDMLKNEPVLRKRLEDANTATATIRDECQRAVSELKHRNRELVDSQKTLIDSIKAQTRLEQELNAAQNRNDELRSSLNATKAEHEKTVARLWAESSELKNRLEQKSAELAATVRRLNEKTDDGETCRQRTEQLRMAMDVYQKKNCEEKKAADQRIAELKARVESATTELVSANARLYDAQAETAGLECRLRGVKGQLEMEVMKTASEKAAEREQKALKKKSCVPETTATGKRIAAIRKDDDDDTQPSKPRRFTVDRSAFEMVADCECALMDSTKSDGVRDGRGRETRRDLEVMRNRVNTGGLGLARNK